MTDLLKMPIIPKTHFESSQNIRTKSQFEITVSLLLQSCHIYLNYSVAVHYQLVNDSTDSSTVEITFFSGLMNIQSLSMV